MPYDVDKIRKYLEPTEDRKIGEAGEIGKYLIDSEFRRLFIEEWERAIHNSTNWESLKCIMGLAFDPFQFTLYGSGIEFMQGSGYNCIRESTVRKIEELGLPEDHRKEVDYVFSVVHPDVKQLPIKRPYKELFEELKSSN